MNPSAVVGPLGVIVGAVIAVLGYRRATRVDKAVEHSALVEAQTGAIGQVIAGLNSIIDSLKDDNQSWRDSVKEMRATVAELTLKLDEVVKERDLLRKELDGYLKRTRARTNPPKGKP